MEKIKKLTKEIKQKVEELEKEIKIKENKRYFIDYSGKIFGYRFDDMTVNMDEVKEFVKTNCDIYEEGDKIYCEIVEIPENCKAYSIISAYKN